MMSGEPNTQLRQIGQLKLNSSNGPSGNLSKEELLAEIKQGSIDTVVAATVDVQGRLLGKRLPAAYFVKSGSASKYQLAEITLIGD